MWRTTRLARVLRPWRCSCAGPRQGLNPEKGAFERVVIAILCVFSLVLVACRDDDDEASLETFCEKNAELTEINEELFVPPMDETPDEVETLVAEGLLVLEEMEAAAPEFTAYTQENCTTDAAGSDG